MTTTARERGLKPSLLSPPGANRRPGAAAVRSPIAIQQTFDELGTLLRETTFVVVDLETTGGSPRGGASITEFGAVKVRGGEPLGEFQTLVRPAEPIPPFIQVLTGITDAMVADAPPIGSVLPAFLEFAAGSVLVAHNAPFDIGFLRFYADALGIPWPPFAVLDTATLARRVVTRDDAPDCRLSSLARLFHAETTPNHRALADARATVDVLHGLIGRLGNLGVATLEELRTFSSRVSAAQRRKRHLAEPLPHAPGVYLFRDSRGRVLYVGTSKDLRTRVRTYFTASETRSRMGEMVGLAESVDAITCSTALEAEVRELRLIAQHNPRYNRRSKYPDRATWIKLTVEPWPRLSLVKAVRDDGAEYLGPFRTRRLAQQAVSALHESFPIRQCGGRLAKQPQRTACALAEMGRCLSPCDGQAAPAAYAEIVARLRTAIAADPAAVVTAVESRMARLAEAERFEDAGAHRDRLVAFVRTSARMQRLAALSSCPELVAALRGESGRWEVHVVRYGRLAAAGTMPGGVDAREWTDSLVSAAETVVPGPGPVPAATAEESERVLRWLERPGVRLIRIEGAWTCPVHGAESYAELLDSADASRAALVPFDTPRLTATLSRPPR